MPLKLVLEGVIIVALSITSQEQTQENRVCCFLILLVLSISEGFFFFPDYLEVAIAVVGTVWSFVHRYSVDIFSYSGPSGILGAGGKQNS